MQHPSEDGVLSMLQVAVSSDMQVVCSASNAFGSDNVTFNIKASESPHPSRAVWVFLSGSIVSLLKSLL